MRRPGARRLFIGVVIRGRDFGGGLNFALLRLLLLLHLLVGRPRAPGLFDRVTVGDDDDARGGSVRAPRPRPPRSLPCTPGDQLCSPRAFETAAAPGLARGPPRDHMIARQTSPCDGGGTGSGLRR